ncbi:MAG: hypothetical protein F4180_02160 [Chloroflexi bacterium]|nr:hypothetical protein [Chloroflexota bacterium]
MSLFEVGLKVSAIALKVNISNRTVYRVIQRELGSTSDATHRRGKRAIRGRALRERASVKQLTAWRQYSMSEMAGVKVA